MTDEERMELIWARGTAMAALACVHQLCRVMQDYGVLTVDQIRDALSEALASAETLAPKRPIESEINHAIARAIRSLLNDWSPS